MGQIPYVPQNVFFVFLMQFGLRRAAAFVLSPIHLFNVNSKMVYTYSGRRIVKSRI